MKDGAQSRRTSGCYVVIVVLPLASARPQRPRSSTAVELLGRPLAARRLAITIEHASGAHDSGATEGACKPSGSRDGVCAAFSSPAQPCSADGQHRKPLQCVAGGKRPSSRLPAAVGDGGGGGDGGAPQQLAPPVACSAWLLHGCRLPVAAERVASVCVSVGGRNGGLWRRLWRGGQLQVSAAVPPGACPACPSCTRRRPRRCHSCFAQPATTVARWLPAALPQPQQGCRGAVGAQRWHFLAEV